MKNFKSLFLSLAVISVMVFSSCERYDISSLPDIPGVFPVDTVVTPVTPVDTVVTPVDTVADPVVPVDTVVTPVTPVDTVVTPVTPVDTVVTPVDPLLYKIYSMNLVTKSPDLGPWSKWTGWIDVWDGRLIHYQYITVDPAQYFIKTTKLNLWGGPYPTKEEMRQDRLRVNANFDEYRKIHNYGHSREDNITNNKDCEPYLWMSSISFGPDGFVNMMDDVIIVIDNEFTSDGHRRIIYDGMRSFGTYRHTEEGTVVVDIEFMQMNELVKIEDPEKQKIPGRSDYWQLRRITDEDIEDDRRYSVIPHLEKASFVLRMEGEGENLKLYFDTDIMTDFDSHETVPYTIEYELFMELTDPYARFSEIDQYLLPDDM